MNYRDLQNISNLSQQILVEGAKEEHNVLNRWPYTSPYLQESTEVYDEEYRKLPVGKMMWKAVNRTEREADTRVDRENAANEPYGYLSFDRAAEEQEKAEKNKERNYKMIRVADTHSKKEAKAKSKLKTEQVDLYDIILSHLLDEGYAETQEQAEVIMVNMSEDWRQSIMEENSTVLAAKGGVAGAVQVKQTKTPGFLGTGIGSKTVSTPIPGTFTRNTPGRVRSGPRPFDAYGSGSKGAEAEMSDRSGPTDAERSRYNSLVTSNNTVGDDGFEPSPRGVNRRAYEKGHSGLMPTRDNQNSTSYKKPNDSWRGY
jgi:hypothetical protein